MIISLRVLLVGACVCGQMTTSAEMYEIFVIESTNLWQMRVPAVELISLYIYLSIYLSIYPSIYMCITNATLFCQHKYRCDDDAVDRSNKMKWCSEWIRWTCCQCCCGCYGIRSKGTTHFDMHDSGHGRKFNVRQLQLHHTTHILYIYIWILKLSSNPIR